MNQVCQLCLHVTIKGINIILTAETTNQSATTTNNILLQQRNSDHSTETELNLLEMVGVDVDIFGSNPGLNFTEESFRL